MAAIVGGTASELTGGKFANGAITSAFAWTFNFEKHRVDEAELSDAGKIFRGLKQLTTDLANSENAAQTILNMDPEQFRLFATSVGYRGPLQLEVEIKYAKGRLGTDAMFKQYFERAHEIGLVGQGLSELALDAITGKIALRLMIDSFAIRPAVAKAVWEMSQLPSNMQRAKDIYNEIE